MMSLMIYLMIVNTFFYASDTNKVALHLIAIVGFIPFKSSRTIKTSFQPN